MWKVVAKDKNGHVVGQWSMHDKNRAEDLYREKKAQGYIVTIQQV